MSSFSTSDEKGVLVITLNNAADLNDFRSNSFRETLYETIQDRSQLPVAFDLSATDYLSSSGVAILVGLKRRLEQQGGKLVLVGVQTSVVNLLKVMKLTQYFTFTGDLPEALAALRPFPTE